MTMHTTTPDMTGTLELQQLTKAFSTREGRILAVDNISFTLHQGEIFTMLGPSGCGKTTTLRMIAGLETPTSGRVMLNGCDMAGMTPLARRLGMVFQSYALFPHMNMFDNIAYGLRVRKTPAAEIKQRVEKMIDVVGLSSLAHRFPADLSGGQQQRMSIARALVYSPGLLLLDEPLANLDAKLRVELREEIRRIQRELGILSIYVTHDQEEAMSISDRIAVFNRGQVEQLGPPQEVYSRPRSLFVADFMGKANFLPASLCARDQRAATVRLQDGNELSTEAFSAASADEVQTFGGTEAIAMVRPEHIEIGEGDGPRHSGTVKRIQFLGSFTRYIVDSALSSRAILIDTQRPVRGLGEGNQVAFKFSAQDCIAYLRQ